MRLPAHFDPLAGAVRAMAKHFQWLRVDAIGNQSVVNALEFRTGKTENDAGLERQKLFARPILHPASGIVDVNKPHAGSINQVDRVDDGIHGLAEAARPLFTELL